VDVLQALSSDLNFVYSEEKNSGRMRIRRKKGTREKGE
jgi:hypothetical protein